MPSANQKTRRKSLRAKLTLGLMSIAAVLLISSIISVLEYRSMSSYVSSLIADDISSINVAQKLSEMSSAFNLEVLAAIGEEEGGKLPEYDQSYFFSHVDSLKASMSSNAIQPLADSVLYGYSAYMLTALELEDVLDSDFINSRSWYFDRLQPRYVRLNSSIEKLIEAIHSDLRLNSENFDSGFYRSIVPGIVAVGVGLLLVLMLLVFMLIYYVNPLYRMLDSLENYSQLGKRYNLSFDGDDQLSELNRGISEITAENQLLRKRIAALKSEKNEPQGD